MTEIGRSLLNQVNTLFHIDAMVFLLHNSHDHPCQKYRTNIYPFWKEVEEFKGLDGVANSVIKSFEISSAEVEQIHRVLRMNCCFFERIYGVLSPSQMINILPIRLIEQLKSLKISS